MTLQQVFVIHIVAEEFGMTDHIYRDEDEELIRRIFTGIELRPSGVAKVIICAEWHSLLLYRARDRVESHVVFSVALAQPRFSRFSRLARMTIRPGLRTRWHS